MVLLQWRAVVGGLARGASAVVAVRGGDLSDTRATAELGLVDSRFRPADAVRTADGCLIVLTRVELERAEIAVTVEEFRPPPSNATPMSR